MVAQMNEENLFGAEEATLRMAEDLLQSTAREDIEWPSHYRKLTDNYKRLLNQSVRLMHIGDLMQNELHRVSELLRSTEEKYRVLFEQSQASRRFLEVTFQNQEIPSLLKECVREIKSHTGCSAVGIRILDEDHYIPYMSFDGFSQSFYQAENRLSIESDKCMCINVMRGDVDPKATFYTQGGSFYMNSATRFLATVSEEEKGETRDECFRAGYESMAMAPIRFLDRILGLIQVADTKEDMVPLNLVEMLEEMGMQLGTAIMRCRTAEALRQSEEHYRQMFQGNRAIQLLVDPETEDIVDANPAASEFYGYDIKELKQLKISDINTSSPDCLSEEMAMARSGQRHCYVFRHKLASTEIRDVEVHSSPVEEKGRTLLYSIIHDVTDRKRAERDLKNAFERFYTILSNQYAGLLLVSSDGAVEFANQAFCDQFGLEADPSALQGLTSQEIIQRIQNVYDDPTHAVNHIREIVLGEEAVRGEEIAIRGDRHYLRDFVPIQIGDKLYGRLWQHRDITDYKKAEKALRESEERYRLLAENSLVGVFLHQDMFFVYANPMMQQILGYSIDELKKMRFSEVLPSDLDQQAKRLGAAGYAGQDDPSHYQTRIVNKRGEERWVEISAAPVRYRGKPSAMGTINDITERKRAEEQLQASLREKEVLLKEIHHRVKNNLTLICELLYLQGENLKDEAQRGMLEDLEARVRSMAVAHEQLYQSESLGSINVREYVSGLVDHLCDSSWLGTRIELNKSIDEAFFGLDTAIPVGFILTELVTNCYRHAFTGEGEGEIRITLRSMGQDEFELVVSDNGIGMPEEIDLENPKSLGLDLVSAFVEKLKGSIEILRDQGTEVRIKFKEI